MFKLSASLSGNKPAMNIASDENINNRDCINDESNGLDLSSDDIENSASSFSKSRLINLEWSDSTSVYMASDDEPVDELKPELVRWFYKNFSDKQWTEFNGYDSLRIENRYRQLSELELKWFSNSVRNLKPNVTDRSSSSSPIPFDSPKRLTPSDARKTPDYLLGQECSPTSEVCDRVVVRGGLYEVDLLQRTCASIFWPGEECVITRGTWFYEANWQPLDLDTCETLERSHLLLFKGKKGSDYIIDAKSPKKALHSEVFIDYNVDWYAPHEVYLYSKATPTKIVRSFTQKLGGYFQKSTGSKLLRGYKEAATDVDRPRDITHLVFVVHGIGQKMDIGGRILHNTALIRQTVASLQEKFFPMSNERAEFFPVEWRMSLTLDGGLVEAITPMNVVPLRNFLNSSAMDIMYYTSPIYSAEIQQGVINELNRLYTLFTQRNPHMNTKVSVVAHSLGCVIVYDIITGWLPQGPYDANSKKDPDLVPGKSRLKFHLDNFFCLGSPLSVFLALRFPRGQHGYHLFPPSLCNRLYNIFHLSDPVAYRLEPLVIREYCKIAPVQIRAHNASPRTPYCDMPLELIVTPDKDKEKDKDSSPSPIPTPKDDSSISPTETPVRERGWSIWSLVRGGHKNQEGTSSPQQMDSPTQGMEHRLDYILRSSSVGISYWSAMTSHTGYWSNPDVAYFILTQIFPEMEENFELSGASAGSNVTSSANNQNSFSSSVSEPSHVETITDIPSTSLNSEES